MRVVSTAAVVNSRLDEDRKTRSRLRCGRSELLLFVFLMSANLASAEQDAAASFAPSAEQLTNTLPNVVVTATRNERRAVDVAAAIDSVSLDNIVQARLGVNLSEVLDDVPGVLVRNRQNYAQDEQVSVRGFGARSMFGVRGVRLYTDGIPATMPDGSGQVSHFNLDSAERVEVLRGPFSALYGNSSGGVIQLFTADGSANPELRSGIVVGSYGTTRASTNLRGSSDALGYNVSISRFETDGYREHSAAIRNSGNAKLSWQVGDNGTFTVIGNSVDIPMAQDPLGLSAAQFRDNPRQATAQASLFNTRKTVSQNQIGAVYEHALDDRQHLRIMGYAGGRAVEQFLAIPSAAQANPLQAGGVIDLDGNYSGGDLRWSLATGALELTAGLSADGQRQHRRGYENFVGPELGVRGQLRRDERNTVSNVDFYAQAEWKFADRWSASAGARSSRVRFHNDDHYVTAGNPDDSGRRDYSATSPVAALLFHPSVDSSIYASWGRGFETPTFAELGYRSDGAGGLNFGLQPARSNNVEIGTKRELGSHFRFDMALFRTDTDNGIAVATNSGGRSTFRNVGRSRRQGLEAAVDVNLAPRWKLNLAATLLDAKFRSTFLACTSTPCSNPTTPVDAGSRIPGVAERAIHGELQWGGERGWRVGISADHLGRIAANDVNNAFASAYTIFSANLGYQFALDNGDLHTFLRIDNFMDRRYVGSLIVNDGNGRYFEPGADRAFLLGAQWLWRAPH